MKCLKNNLNLSICTFGKSWRKNSWEFLKTQEQKIKREALNDQKKEEIKNKLIDEKKNGKEYVQNYFKQKENEIKKQNLIIKEKYKKENKILKSVNEELSKKIKSNMIRLKMRKKN